MPDSLASPSPPPPPTPRASTPPPVARTARQRLIDRGVRLYRRAYRSWLAAKQRLVPTERQRLFGLTIAIGGLCGLAAVAFHVAIERVAAASVERAMAAAGPAWIWGTIAVPVGGALAAGAERRVVGLINEVAIAHAYLQARRARAPGAAASHTTAK